MRRRTKHIRFLLNSITHLNNDITKITFKLNKTHEDSRMERFLISKMRIKVSLIAKYNRRLKVLSV
jgi:hypothetical protein